MAEAARYGPAAGIGRWLTAWLVFAAIAVAATAYFVLVYVPGERDAAIDVWRGHLSAMADDRKAAITAWLDERRADGTVVAEYPMVAALLAGEDSGFFPSPPSELPHRHLQGLLDAVDVAHGNSGLYIVASNGEVRASSTESAPLAASRRSTCERALRSGLTQFDFFAREDGVPMVAVVAPVRVQDRPVGTVVQLADPGRWVYPLLHSEPIPSRSAESLLGRQVGDQVEYLSPLRHRPGRPLSFRLPVDAAPLAVVAGIRGEEGFKEYPDYRGVPVLGATRHIPGTGWGLVVKVDRDEALAGFAGNVTRSALAIAVLLLAMVGLGLGVHRALAARHRRQLGESEARFALVRDHAIEGIWFVNGDGVIRDANLSAAAMHGCTREELIGSNVRECRSPEDPTTFSALLDAVWRAEGTVFETLHQRRDGSVFPIEVSTRLVLLEGEEVLLSVYRDITERKRAEETLRQQTVDLKARNEELMRFNSAAVDREVRMVELKQEVNELCRQLGRPPMHTLGFIDEEPHASIAVPAAKGREPTGNG